jgi:aryl-alcohol dehydrogenase-like predicted oxidoreductase
VSVVGFGTWQFGGEWDREYTQSEANAIMDAAREAEINLIDTAECYGDHLSEELVGNAIARDREKWVPATKFGHKFNDLFERDQLWSPSDVQKQLEAGKVRHLGISIGSNRNIHQTSSASRVGA